MLMSGIQHISAITRDLLYQIKLILLSFYNLKDSEIKSSAKAQDFYKYAGELIQKELDNNEILI